MIAALTQGLDKRLSSLIVLAALLLGALVLGINALVAWRTERAEVILLEDRTLMLEARAAAAKAAQPGPEAAPPDARLLIAGQTSGLVSAELQRVISDIAGSVGATVRSTDVPDSQPVDEVTDAAGGKLVKVRLNAEIEVMEQSLPDLLYAIETHLPVLVVDAISLRPNRRIDTGGGDMQVSAPDRPLALRLTVSAFHVGSGDSS